MELASLVIQNAFGGLFYGCFQKTQKFDLNHSEILNFGFNSTWKFEPDPKPEEARSDHIFWAFGKTQSNSNPKVQTRHETRNPRNFDLLQSYQIKSEKRLFKLCIEIFCAKLKIDLKIFAKALEVAKRKTFLRWIEDPWSFCTTLKNAPSSFNSTTACPHLLAKLEQRDGFWWRHRLQREKIWWSSERKVVVGLIGL